MKLPMYIATNLYPEGRDEDIYYITFQDEQQNTFWGHKIRDEEYYQVMFKIIPTGSFMFTQPEVFTARKLTPDELKKAEEIIERWKKEQKTE